MVRPPRVAEAPVHLECHFHQCVVLPGNYPEQTVHMVIAEVIGVHIRDDALNAEGKLDIARLRPLARLGYLDYTSVESVFTMEISDTGREGMRRRGMGGEARGRPEAAE